MSLDYQLIRDEEGDYRMHEHGTSVWITVGNISVYLKREDEGVVVDLYAHGREFDEPLASTWATFNEADLGDLAA